MPWVQYPDDFGNIISAGIRCDHCERVLIYFVSKKQADKFMLNAHIQGTITSNGVVDPTDPEGDFAEIDENNIDQLCGEIADLAFRDKWRIDGDDRDLITCFRCANN